MPANSSNKRKRDGSVELKVCVICNSRCDDILHEGTAKLKEATNARRNAPNDTSYNEAMDRICIAFDSSLAGDPTSEACSTRR
jgi:hypothetical protein